jgi:hypothetical protein
VQEVVSSNPTAPTNRIKHLRPLLSGRNLLKSPKKSPLGNGDEIGYLGFYILG